MKLYELTEQYKDLQAIEGMDPEAIADTLEGLTGEVEEKANAIVAVRAGMEATIVAIDHEIERLQGMKKVIQNREVSIRDYLKHNMQAMEITNIKCDLFSITLAKGREQAIIDDESLLPDEYVNVKTTIAPDKRLILKDLKDGKDIPGARIERGPESLRIK